MKRKENKQLAPASSKKQKLDIRNYFHTNLAEKCTKSSTIGQVGVAEKEGSPLNTPLDSQKTQDAEKSAYKSKKSNPEKISRGRKIKG